MAEGHRKILDWTCRISATYGLPHGRKLRLFTLQGPMFGFLPFPDKEIFGVSINGGTPKRMIMGISWE